MFALFVTGMPQILSAQNCGWGPASVTVYHWKPKYGTIARFAESIVDTGNGTGFIVILGKDTAGVYTIEGNAEDDARGGDFACLAYTKFNGERNTYRIYDGDMLEQYLETPEYDKKRKEIMLAKLWQFSSEKKYVYGNFKPLYYHVFKQEYEPVVLEIKERNRKLSWQLSAGSSMCWCHYEWACSVTTQ